MTTGVPVYAMHVCRWCRCSTGLNEWAYNAALHTTCCSKESCNTTNATVAHLQWHTATADACMHAVYIGCINADMLSACMLPENQGWCPQ